MVNVKEEIEKIEVQREVLGVMPKNNKRNLTIALNKYNEVYDEVSENIKPIIKEIERRYNKFKVIKKDTEFEEKVAKISEFESLIYLLNDITTPYEKMELDIAIHDLKYYYKKDFELINETIFNCINSFKNVGIALTKNDFTHNKYVYKYMECFFENINDLNTSVLKDTFEEIYWKCPEIIKYVELNIRYLYFKNEAKIQKHYITKKQELLSSNPNFITEYNELKKEVMHEVDLDKYNLINNFLDNKLQIRDYTKEEILNNLSNFIPSEALENIDDKKLEELNMEMIKLMDSLVEYKLYNDYKFLVESVKEAYSKKEKYSKKFIDLKKVIEKKEKDLLKLNSKGLFGAKNEETMLKKQTEIAIELCELYRQLDEIKVYSIMETNITESSNLYDILKFCSYFFDYMFDCMKVVYKQRDEAELKEAIYNLKESIKAPSFTILNNILIDEEKNMFYIIKDKYQFSNIVIKQSDFTDKNLENLITILKKYEVFYNVNKNKINLEELRQICEFKRIVSK